MSGSNRLAGLTARPKDTGPAEVRKVDDVGEARGFVDRTPRKKPGRKPSPRTYQLHPKVFPRVGGAIASEAERLGITQGQFIEQMWDFYEKSETD
jgi:hypothetical protein